MAIPEAIAACARSLASDFVMDGEAVGDRYYAFDLLTFKGNDLRYVSYQYRYFELMGTVLVQQGAIQLVPSTALPVRKREIFTQLRAEGREGVVFKRFDAPYEAGRPASGGTQFKYKFCETASFIVGGANEKRSVSLQLLADGSWFRLATSRFHPTTISRFREASSSAAISTHSGRAVAFTNPFTSA